MADALVEQQGPNYAIAKRLQRWRGAHRGGRRAPRSRSTSHRRRGPARSRGTKCSRPPTPGRAPLRHRDLRTGDDAGADGGAARTRPEPEPAEAPQAEALFSDGAAHGGLWTAAYEPRSALGLAALAGLPATVARPGADAARRDRDAARAERQHRRRGDPVPRRDRRRDPALEPLPRRRATSRSSPSCTLLTRCRRDRGLPPPAHPPRVPDASAGCATRSRCSARCRCRAP